MRTRAGHLIKVLGQLVSDKKMFLVFWIEAYIKCVTPWVGRISAPGPYFNVLSRGPLGDATYQISRL